ncbi:hypothetical protein PMAA_014700 [Paecilomyces variotii No. 5]|uniref:Uncharacterized protein n=1 Tax=Byssochlamys spectabilis (strain No. 5 / NBRC 109023) TaxID=1356009 RepID=V5I0D6_BYSSN|nr:hypothetical protein PMAA_014700 [Paecilomyces variotii No. 5]
MTSRLKQPEIPYFAVPRDLAESQELLKEAGISRKSHQNGYYHVLWYTSLLSMDESALGNAEHEAYSKVFFLRDEEDVYLEDELAMTLRIALCDLRLEENDGPESEDSYFFFNPMSSDDLESFPCDRTHSATDRFLRASESWDGTKPTTTGFWAKPDSESIAGELACELEEYAGVGYSAYQERQYYLIFSDNRGFCPEILHEDLFDALSSAGALQKEGRFGSIFEITDGYCAVPWSVRVNEPHVIVMISHRYTADEKISRAEILTIVAAMMTQLQHKHLEEHCIPPTPKLTFLFMRSLQVMVVSFMNSLRGRILQAHVTDNELVINKSKLYDFDKQADFERSITLFTRHMACDRIGDTRQVVSFDATKRKTARDMESWEQNIHPNTGPDFEGKD